MLLVALGPGALRLAVFTPDERLLQGLGWEAILAVGWGCFGAALAGPLGRMKEGAIGGAILGRSLV